mgnify:CR=1 FL=1
MTCNKKERLNMAKNITEDFDNPYDAAGLSIYQCARILRDNPPIDHPNRPCGFTTKTPTAT